MALLIQKNVKFKIVRLINLQHILLNKLLEERNTHIFTYKILASCCTIVIEAIILIKHVRENFKAKNSPIYSDSDFFRLWRLNEAFSFLLCSTMYPKSQRSLMRD